MEPNKTAKDGNPFYRVTCYVHDIYEYPASSTNSGGKFIYLNFPGWRPGSINPKWRYSVEFPFDIIPEEWRKKIDVGSCILCHMNLGAKEPEDIEICDFETFDTKAEFDRKVQLAKKELGL